MVDLSVDRAELEIPCPKCGHKTKRSIGSLKRDPNIDCAGCGVSFGVDLTEFNKGIRKVEEQLEALKKSLKGFGKR